MTTTETYQQVLSAQEKLEAAIEEYIKTAVDEAIEDVLTRPIEELRSLADECRKFEKWMARNGPPSAEGMEFKRLADKLDAIAKRLAEKKDA